MNNWSLRFIQVAVFAGGCISLLTAMMVTRSTPVGRAAISLVLATGCFLASAYVGSRLVEGAWHISGRVAKNLLTLSRPAVGSNVPSPSTNDGGEL